MQPIERNSLKRILVRAVNWVGDAVMTTPALGLIREYFPDAEITLLANPAVAALFTPHNYIDKTVIFHRNGIHRGIGGRLRLARELRANRFDACFILPNSFESALVPWLARIPKRLGKSSDGRGLLLTDTFRETPAQNTTRHEVEYYLNLLHSFGIEGAPPPPRLCITDRERESANHRLAGFNIKPDDFLIGINPGAAYGSAKRWYPERFAEVGRRLWQTWNARCIIFGGPNELEMAAAIEQRLDGNGINLAGKTTMRELMALIERCDYFITNDSGPMHIAAALGTPLTAIFGSTDHTTTSPYTSNAVIVRKEIPCAPCKLRQCPKDHQCMLAVTVDDVVTASINLQNRNQGKYT